MLRSFACGAMSEAGVEPGTDRLGRPMKTRPTILRSSVKAAISESQQTATLDNVSLSKRPIAHPQGPALKRTTCGNLTNEGNRNTMKAPRKQPMRSMREAEVAESTSEDMLNWFLPEDGLSRTSDTVAEAGSSESEEVPQERSLSEQSVPRPFHLAVSDRLEERAMPGAYTEDIFKYMRQREKHFALMNYMHHQPELNVQMRAILVDWMVEVQ
uniref:G2/mitotic-specific cyclin-B3-like n=1 Tax=Pristiophorus japonicus TaxID=55135 RepID=UPI00398F8DC4